MSRYDGNICLNAETSFSHTLTGINGATPLYIYSIIIYCAAYSKYYGCSTMTYPLPAEISVEEKLAAFDDAPLFMKSLPDDALDNPVVSALQSLAYEGTPDGEFVYYWYLEVAH